MGRPCIEVPQQWQREISRTVQVFDASETEDSGGVGMNVLDRPPPCDVDSETGLLSALLIDPTQTDIASRVLTPADFHDPANAALYSAITTLHDAGKLSRDIRVTLPILRALHLSESQW